MTILMQCCFFFGVLFGFRSWIFFWVAALFSSVEWITDERLKRVVAYFVFTAQFHSVGILSEKKVKHTKYGWSSVKKSLLGSGSGFHTKIFQLIPFGGYSIMRPFFVNKV